MWLIPVSLISALDDDTVVDEITIRTSLMYRIACLGEMFFLCTMGFILSVVPV